MCTVGAMSYQAPQEACAMVRPQAHPLLLHVRNHEPLVPAFDGYPAAQARTAHWSLTVLRWVTYRRSPGLSKPRSH